MITPTNPPPPNPPAPPPRLVGTVITESGAKAYLEDTATKTIRAFRIKESVAGFTVHEIKENSIILLKGEEKIEVKITRVETVKTPVMPVPQNSQNLPQTVQPVTQSPPLPVQPQSLPSPPPPLPVPPTALPPPIIKPVK
jgi:hypothetical protein